jgi:hypothetical protein
MLSIKEIKVKLYTALALSKTRVVSACAPSFNTTKEIPIMRIRIHSTNLVQSCLPDMPVGYESACLSVDKEQEAAHLTFPTDNSVNAIRRPSVRSFVCNESYGLAVTNHSPCLAGPKLDYFGFGYCLS